MSTEHRPTATRRGQQFEHRAEEFLHQRGLRTIARNHRCRGGELDLVMHAGATLVFVEVRYRRAARFGSAAETIDPRKQARIVRAAMHFLTVHHEFANYPCRFDVIAMYGDAHAPTCDWIAGAFSA